MRNACYRSYPARLLCGALAGLFLGLAALPTAAFAHQEEVQAPATAARETTELSGRVDLITVINRVAGTTQQFPVLVLTDGNRMRLENAGAVPDRVVVTVSGSLSGHTLVAEDVRGTTAQGPAPKAAGPRGELTGTIRVFHIDYIDKTSEYGYTLAGDNGQRNIIDFGIPLPGIENGSRATVSGSVDAAGFINVDTIEVLAPPPSPVTAKPTPKTQVTAAAVTTNYAVAALQFPSNTTTPYMYGSAPFTPASINTNVFGVSPNKSAAEYYKEASYGAQLLTGAVTSNGTNWLQATVVRPASGTCSTNAQLNAILATIEGQSKTLAASATTNPVANLDWNGYPGGILYISDSLPCGWAGLGYIGFPRAYTNGYQALWVVGHEMGHGFGLYHAGSVGSCPGSVTIAPSGCTVTEYGDPYVIMGNVNPGHFNAFQKNVLGYIPGGVATHTSGTTATYTLGPIESAGQALYGVRIPTSNPNRTYWVEFRQGIGFDTGFAGINALGAQVRISFPFENQASGYTASSHYDDTQFLDMTPPSGFTDAALVNGATYTDNSVTPPLSIKVTAASATALSVQVVSGGTAATTTTLASSANPSTVNQSVTFTASVTGTNPTGNVAFKDSGSALAGCGAIALSGSGNTRTAACAISTLAAGVHSITADYAGDAGNGSSSSSALSQTVKAATTTTLASSLNPSTLGASVTFTATVAGSAPTGNVGFTSDGTTIAGCGSAALSGSGNSRTATCTTSALTQASHSIVASYGGDGGNGTSSSAPLSQVVNASAPVSTTTTLVSSQNPSTSGASVTFTATVNGSAPTGNVAFTSDGASIASCSAIALSGSGNSRTAACATSSLAVGTHAIVATYAGNSGNAGSASSPLSQVVNSGGGGGGPVATTTALVSSQNPSLSGAPVTFTATVNGTAPTGNVAFTSDGVSIASCNAVALTGGGNSRTAACATSTLTAGTHAIVASYGGDGGNAGSASTPFSQVVNSPSATPTTTTVSSGSNPVTAGNPVALTATVVGNPPVNSGFAAFTANGTPIAGCASVPVTAGAAVCNTTFAAGAYSIVASYGGSASGQASSSPVFSEVVPFAAIGNTIQFASAAYSVNESAGSVMLTVTRIGDVSAAASVAFATAGGTATAGADFTVTSGTLTWLADDSSTRTVVVPIVNDATAEADETFTVTLSGAQGASLGATSVATVTIMDDDGAAASMPGTATVVQNPYALVSVQGGTLNGNTISNLQKDAVIQLGAIAGAPGSFAKIDFQGFTLGAGNTLTIRSGAAGQTVYLTNVNATNADITGVLQAQGGNGAAAPTLVVQSVPGLTVNPGGSIIAPAGVTLDTLGSPNTTGGDLVNQGWIDGGSALALSAAKVNGGGTFLGNALTIATFGNLNNPVNGAHFLANGLQLYPSTGGNMSVTLAAYGGAPQFINLMAHGNATFSMPSAWPNGSSLPANNRPVMPNEIRAAGAPNPAYGAGSIIVRATGNLTLNGGVSNDLVFSGGLVLIAGGTIDVHGTSLDNGWTTSGQPFQGMFLEAASIVDSTAAPAIMLRTNNLNWANFSVRPALPVQTWTLQQQLDGTAQFVSADASAPHLNFYWTSIEAAAANQCWQCLVNGQVIDLSVAP